MWNSVLTDEPFLKSFFEIHPMKAENCLNIVQKSDTKLAILPTGKTTIKSSPQISVREVSEYEDKDVETRLQTLEKLVRFLKQEVSDMRKKLHEQEMKTDRLWKIFTSTKIKQYKKTEINTEYDIEFETNGNIEVPSDSDITNFLQEIDRVKTNENLMQLKKRYDSEPDPGFEHRVSILKPVRRKIVILADEQGTGLQNVLQDFLGASYHVSVFTTPGAKLAEVVEVNHLAELTRKLDEKDFVVILGGCNDVSMAELLSHLYYCFNSMNTVNVIVSEVPFNKYLDITTLNKEVEKICKDFKNVTFIHMNYYSKIKNNFLTSLTQRLLKVILQFSCSTDYQGGINNKEVSFGDIVADPQLYQPLKSL